MNAASKLPWGKWLTLAWFTVFSIFCIIPFLYIVSISLSNESDIANYGYKLIPKHITTHAYDFLLQSPKQLLSGYGVSITVTVIGTVASLLITTKLAYALSRKDFGGANSLSFIVFFTMLFSGGLVPWYILIKRYLQIDDSLLVLILPYIIMPWHVLLMKGFLSDIPPALIESAKIDGAGEWRIFYQIILPLAKPALATVALFIAFIYWNDWWLAMLFIDNQNLIPLQYMLYRIMNNIQFLSTSMQSSNISIDITAMPNETARMAIAVMAAGPILFVFPFFQKYFVKGLTVGAVKG
ncbi:carbohydrate ABC transporter permease [Paenibacillus sacheonensis]|uniref:ABC transporter permease subunit n=1 Tax=Paenibacillus sacheonensis TaxID=742054 RepID=A0A7X5BXM4_9BACL|nr:carbohydrate ABC transporter permease [Paenibacillus sacheonensis]MBM7565924.1 putative aldouronate transport system permease protein [Paenibacillus sacheonensis]NBC68762.1 ABC transporter permease subunit [Paenibacillus sacheonensis]